MYVHVLMRFSTLVNSSACDTSSTACACVLQGAKDHTLLSMDTLLASALGSVHDPLPTRRVDIDLTPVSLVLGTPMMCYPNSPLEFQSLNGNSRRSHATAVGGSGQSFKGDVVAAVQPNIQAELQVAKVSTNSSFYLLPKPLIAGEECSRLCMWGVPQMNVQGLRFAPKTCKKGCHALLSIHVESSLACVKLLNSKPEEVLLFTLLLTNHMCHLTMLLLKLGRCKQHAAWSADSSQVLCASASLFVQL